uniref:BTB domain-containing protein n=1 Tax=Amorphochlora amoebiformis TaxID=1561963 RepID=A0A7S0D7B5_9EUKA|mmetsp:Transcript_2088/g.2910  ORF Transcript_2088/g.2910 Transcript_2088/m.2910 type:complete len:296 (+) Transcript_2088:395-1282(+)
MDAKKIDSKTALNPKEVRIAEIEGLPCDVVIKVGSKCEIWTHKSTLILASPIFKNIICDCADFPGEICVPETETIKDLVEIDSDAWIRFLKCVHPLTCGLVVKTKTLLEVGAIAFKYDAKGICHEVREAFKQLASSSLTLEDMAAASRIGMDISHLTSCFQDSLETHLKDKSLKEKARKMSTDMLLEIIDLFRGDNIENRNVLRIFRMFKKSTKNLKIMARRLISSGRLYNAKIIGFTENGFKVRFLDGVVKTVPPSFIEVKSTESIPAAAPILEVCNLGKSLALIQAMATSATT